MSPPLPTFEPKSEPEDDSISIPLYVAAFVITLAGLQAVNYAIEDANFTVTTTLLTMIGFGFSYGCRWLKIQPRVIEFVLVVLVGYLIYGLWTQNLTLGVFMPDTVDKPEDRLAVFLAWFAVVRSWTLTSDDSALFSGVLTIAMIGLVGTGNLNTPVIVWFFVAAIAVTFLLIHQNFLQGRALASTRERARPQPQALAMQAVLSVVTLLCVFVLGSLLVVPFQSLFQGLSLAQTVRQLISGSRGALEPVPVGTRFSDDSSLDVGTGGGWPTGTEVVLRVTRGDNQEHYWRGRTYDRYTGTGWQSSLEDEHLNMSEAAPDTDSQQSQSWPAFAVSAPLTPGDPEEGTQQRGENQAVLFDFEVTGLTQQFYYTGLPRRVAVNSSRVSVPQQYADGRLDSDGMSLARTQYSVLCNPTPDAMQPDVQQRLRQAGTRYPPEMGRYLDSPENLLDNGVTTEEDIAYFRQAARQAIQGLPSNHNTPFDRAMAIRDWVAARCVYSLSINPIDPNTDHVHAFLADTRRGYCDLFASSMAVLCRQIGLPARLATGFAPGERASDGFALRALDKHAWVEVYFPKSGWVAFDPTTGSRTDGSLPTEKAKPKASWLDTAWHALLANGPLPIILFAAIILLLTWVVKVEVYDRFRGRLHSLLLFGRPLRPAEENVRARTDVGRRYARLNAALARLGLPRRAAETPDEYAARAETFLRDEQARLGVSLPVALVPSLTSALVAARYGGSAFPADAAADDAALVRLSSLAAQAHRRRLWEKFWHRR